MLVENKVTCSGCGACASVCPRGCIEMKEDMEGFLYPVIDESRCVKCNRCEKVCPNKNYPEISNSAIIKETYAAYCKDDLVRSKSSSGGIFSMLAECILSDGGVVCGAAMSADCRSVSHMIIENAEELSCLRGSKYLQSDIKDTYKKIKSHLAQRRKVLFTGTPCEIVGLKRYLNCEDDLLYCMEVVCHGTPSPALWRRYVDTIKNRYNGSVRSVNFRCKDNGWRDFGISEFAGGKRLFFSKDEDPYMRMFLTDVSLRPSCYACKAKQLKFADITVADFWGISRVAPEMNDNQGVSMVILRTKKGKALFNRVSDMLEKKEIPYEKAVHFNSAEHASVARPPERDSFYEDMYRMSFEELANKYGKPLPMTAKRALKKTVRTLLKKLKMCAGGLMFFEYGLEIVVDTKIRR